jgi:hypothetical protein
MILMDIDNEMIDFTINYSVFHWHSLESYRHFQNLVEYIKYFAFLFCIYQCNVLSAVIPVGSDKTYLNSCSHSSDVVLFWPRTSVPYNLIISRHTHLNLLGGFSRCFTHPQACTLWCGYVSAPAEVKCSVWSSRNKYRVFLEWTNTDCFSWSQVWKGQS